MEMTPIEDLSREHGLLNRALLIYEEFVRRLKECNTEKLRLLYSIAIIIRLFIEDHHEKTEENYIFPILIKDTKYVGIINALIKQHEIGREITDKILQLSSKNEIDTNEKDYLIKYITLFVKMYRYHEAIEDTEVFPKLRELLSDEQYKILSEILEKEEGEEEEEKEQSEYQKYLLH